MELPKLYKKTATGAVEEWSIRVEGATMVTTYGHVGGTLQSTSDTVAAGKNAGRKNATTPPEQAEREAAAKHQKRLKSGYVTSLEAALAGEVDAAVQGGVPPMLAENWWDHHQKVEYPRAAQPKLDGHRMVAVVRGGDATLWTRKREPITSMPHVVEELRRLARGWDSEERVLDGELFLPGMKLQQIAAMARPKKPVEGHERLQYHLFDKVMPACFLERFDTMCEDVRGCSPVIQLVPTFTVKNAQQLDDLHASFKAEGYEGTIVRKLGVPYEHRRTQQLLKRKDMRDGDFAILGVEEGRGKMRGHAGAVVCATADGKEFRATPEGEMSVKRETWEGRDALVGKVGEVRYQDLSLDGIPLFPIFVRVKEVI